MRTEEIVQVQTYLRQRFATEKIKVLPPKREDHPIEVYLNDEILGVLYRDEDEGEVSYALTMTILDIDLPEI